MAHLPLPGRKPADSILNRDEICCNPWSANILIPRRAFVSLTCWCRNHRSACYSGDTRLRNCRGRGLSRCDGVSFCLCRSTYLGISIHITSCNHPELLLKSLLCKRQSCVNRTSARTYVVENVSVTASSVTVTVTISVEVDVKVLWESVIIWVRIRVVSTV